MSAKLDASMDLDRIVETMSEEDANALDVANIMMREPSLYLGVILCDKLDIRGEKLAVLFYHCCGGKVEKMAKTLQMFSSNIYSKEDIDSNLSHESPEVFLDESIVGVHVPLYSDEFKVGHPDWDEFAYLQRRNFDIKVKRKNALENIPTWIVQGQTMMYPEKYVHWESAVMSRATDFTYGLCIKNTLEIMAALENGASIDEAKKILANQHHSGGTELEVRELVLSFSNRGPEFYTGTLTDPLTVEQSYKLEQTKKENAALAEKYSNKANNNVY